MSLLQCMYCKHRSYLFCCNKQQTTIQTICQACLYEFPINAHQNCLNCTKPIIRDIIYLQNVRQRQAAMVKLRQPQQVHQNALQVEKRSYLPTFQNQRANWQQYPSENQYQDKFYFKGLNQSKSNCSFPIINSQPTPLNRNNFGFGSEEIQLTAQQIQAANEVLNFPIDNGARLNRQRAKRGEAYMARSKNYLNDYESSIYDESDGHTVSDLNR